MLNLTKLNNNYVTYAAIKYYSIYIISVRYVKYTISCDKLREVYATTTSSVSQVTQITSTVIGNYFNPSRLTIYSNVTALQHCKPKI